MRKYVLARVASLIPTFFGLTVLVFLLVRLIPGTVVEELLGAEAQATQGTLQSLRVFFGLDQPIYLQYLHWIEGVVRGDLGQSWLSGLSVLQMVLSRLQVTAELTVGAMFVALVVGITFGIASASRENTGLDHAIRVLGLVGLSLPIFWQASMLILLLSLGLGWAPPVGYVGPTQDLWLNLHIMILPMLVLGTVVAATIMRMTRASMLDVLRQDYIRTARAKGQHGREVLWIHALRNALIPIVTVAGLQMGYLLGGTVVAEQVFTLPGVGQLLLTAIDQRDYPLVQGTVLIVAVLFMMTNLAVDVLYVYVDPRIRYD